MGRGNSNECKIIFKCQDFGVGIPEKNLKKVFEPFFTTKFGKGGSGLGMAICYQLVTEALSGTIAVSSNVGSGTEFTIEFSAVAVQDTRKRLGQKVH